MIGMAYFFKFQPSEIYDLTIKEFLFWAQGINKASKWFLKDG